MGNKKEDIKKNQEQPQEKKKDNKLLIILIIILLLLTIPAYFWIKNCTEKEDIDVAIVKQINKTYQIYEETHGKPKDEHEAHTYARTIGYIIENGLLIKENRLIVWDSVNDCFVLLENDAVLYSPVKNTSTGYKLWTYVKETPSSSRYSVYWCGTEKVTKSVVIGQDADGKDIIEEQYFYYDEHDYTRDVNTKNITYTCDECGHTYTVKVVQ